MFKFFKSVSKGAKISSIQQKIIQTKESMRSNLSNAYDFSESALRERSEKQSKLNALENEYYDYLYSLEGINTCLSQQGLDKNYLKETVEKLNEEGGLVNIKGHVLSYSTVAYVSTLTFCIFQRKNNIEYSEIIKDLFYYWEGNIDDMQLLRNAGFDC